MTTEDAQADRVRGPLTGPVPNTRLRYDLGALGYVEEEFILEGTAESYRLIGERSEDGSWRAAPDSVAPFATRLLVRRPAAPDRFSGTVVAEWLNVSAGADGAPEWSMAHPYLIRHGHAWMGVSAQKVGIDGGGIVEGLHLKRADPSRYARLMHPGDAFSYDMFTRAGRVLSAPDGDSLLAGVPPRLVLAAGDSQSAAFLVTYVNVVDRGAGVYDGFLVHARGASGASLNGLPVQRRQMIQQPEAIRQDARVPIMVLQSETDVVSRGAGAVRQDDGAQVRVWEIAGAAHVDTYMLTAAAFDDGHLPARQLAELLRPTTQALGRATASPVNSGPQQHYVAQAALAKLGQWAAAGIPPPHAARLAINDNGSGLVLDEHGNARCGLRTPWVDVPTATLSGLSQSGEGFSRLAGRTLAFGTVGLTRLYPGGRNDYLRRFTQALDSTIAAGFLLAEDREEIRNLAAASYPPGR